MEDTGTLEEMREQARALVEEVHHGEGPKTQALIDAVTTTDALRKAVAHRCSVAIKNRQGPALQALAELQVWATTTMTDLDACMATEARKAGWQPSPPRQRRPPKSRPPPPPPAAAPPPVARPAAPARARPSRASSSQPARQPRDDRLEAAPEGGPACKNGEDLFNRALLQEHEIDDCREPTKETAEYAEDLIAARRDFELHPGTRPAGMRVDMMYGPPGCGKTNLALYIAKQLGYRVVELSRAKVGSSLVHQFERNVSDFFAFMHSLDEHLLVFMDECEALVPDREKLADGGAGAQVKKDVVAELLKHLNKPRKLLIIMATNMPGEVDAAIKNRVNHWQEVVPPDRATLELFLRQYLRRFMLNMDELPDLGAVLEACEGLALRDMERMCMAVSGIRFRPRFFFRVPGELFVECSSADAIPEGAEVVEDIAHIAQEDLSSARLVPPERAQEALLGCAEELHRKRRKERK